MTTESVRELLAPVEDGPLNAMLMGGTSVIHREAERRPFMVAFFKGLLTRDAYAAFLGRLSFVYVALEECAEGLRDDPVVGRMYAPELFRLSSIERDVAFWAGPEWRSQITPTPASKAYADRIREVAATTPHAYAAHQWLRYLGYVLGQDLLRRLVAKGFGASDQGVAFYSFPGIAEPKAFLGGYHARMNAMPLDAEQKMEVVDEGYRAFQLNIGLTDELAADFGIGDVNENETSEILDRLKAEHP